MNSQRMNLVIIPEEELINIKTTQQEILRQLQSLQSSSPLTPISGHITAKEFMTALRICRSKFDQLVSENKIKTIKKRRKIYLPHSEVHRYFRILLFSEYHRDLTVAYGKRFPEFLKKMKQ